MVYAIGIIYTLVSFWIYHTFVNKKKRTTNALVQSLSDYRPLDDFKPKSTPRKKSIIADDNALSAERVRDNGHDRDKG